MDDIERQFIQGIAKHSNIMSKSMAGENASKYTGLQNKRTEQILRNITNNSDTSAMGPTPIAPNGDYQNVSLEPLEITQDMIEEIREFGGDVLLPENVGRGDVMGNPSVVQKEHFKSNSVDDNQLELDFSKISTDQVYEQYDVVINKINKLDNELKNIKALIESKYND